MDKPLIELIDEYLLALLSNQMGFIVQPNAAEKCLQQMREEVANKITGLLSQSDVRAAADKYDFEI